MTIFAHLFSVHLGEKKVDLNFLKFHLRVDLGFSGGFFTFESLARDDLQAANQKNQKQNFIFHCKRDPKEKFCCTVPHHLF